MSDIFIENLVQKKKDSKDMLKIGGIIAALVLVFAVVIFLELFVIRGLEMLFALLLFGACYGAYFLIGQLSLEFETIVVNGSIDVDKIMARSRRKRLISLSCRDAEEFGRYVERDHANKQYQTRFIACDSPLSDDVWYMVLRHPKHGRTLLVINANQRMLDAIKPFLPRPVAFAAFTKGSKPVGPSRESAQE